MNNTQSNANPDAPQNSLSSTPVAEPLVEQQQPSTSNQTKSSGRQAIIVLFLCVMVENISNTLIIPLLPFYAQRFDASPLQTTLVFSMSALMGFLFAPVWGALSDRFGRRAMLLVSIAGSSLACFGFGFINSLPTLFACNALAGISAGSSIIASAYVGDTTTQETRSQRIGILGGAFGLGFALGPIIGGVLVGPASNPNYFLPAAVAGAIGTLAFLAALLALPESPKVALASNKTSGNALDFQLLGQTLATPLSRTLLVALFLLTFAVSGVQATLGLWAKDVVGWGPQQVSFFYGLWGIFGIIIQVAAIGFLVKLIGEANLFVIGLLIYSLGLFVLPIAGVATGGNLLYLMPLIILASLGYSSCRVIFSSLLSQSTKAINQGKVMGIAASASALAGMVAPAVAGYAFGHWGPSWPFWIGPILILIAALVSWPTLAQARISMKNVKQRVQNFQTLFNLLDYDQSGSIEIADFEKSIADIATARQWSQDSAEFRTAQSFWLGLGYALQSAVDVDDDGQITLDEWTEYLSKDLDIDFADAFTRLIDYDNDGQICLSELNSFYQLYKGDTANLQADFQELDLDQDGSISLEEMQETFERFMYTEHAELSQSWLLGI
ncbi:MAG: MFS transporter [Cyanothece sp. SIO2G6]|nr:MFS transporter [Cyanothece sp. SIO2G6]